MPLARFSHATQSENLPKNMGHLAPAAISAPVGLFSQLNFDIFYTASDFNVIFFFCCLPKARIG